MLYRYPTEYEMKKQSKFRWLNGYIQVYRSLKQFQIMAPESFIKMYYHKMIERTKEAASFHRAINYLCTDVHFKEFYDHASLSGGYFMAIYFNEATIMSSAKSTYNPLDENLMNSQKISINCKYIHTTLDMNFANLKQAMSKEQI